MKFQLIFTILSALFSLYSCTMPDKLSQASLKKVEYYVQNHSLNIEIGNPLMCPLTISAKSPDPTVQKKLDKNFPAAIPPKTDTIISYRTDKSKEEISITFSGAMGDPSNPVRKEEINLPFPEGRTYKIIQGYNGSYSHSSNYSRYAIDFDMKIGDTVCSVANGYVVGVIEGYSKGGKTKKWRDYANFITLFHPEMNVYTQYVHLAHEGSFVEVGDRVVAGQVIGLSGKTGYTDIEHLHFNVLEAVNSGIQSTEISFKEGYKGADLKRGDLVKR
ncbi:MAG: M23 family metallopeptidase [Crocinitomicaceae bacterium]